MSKRRHLETCFDIDFGEVDPDGYGCAAYSEEFCGCCDTDTFLSLTMCCVCGGGSEEE